MREKFIEELFSLEEGQRARIAGWVYRRRELGGVVFVILRDSTGVVQVVFKKDLLGEEQMRLARRLTIESSLVVEGVIHRDERAPGGMELHATNLQVFNLAEDFPLKKDTSKEVLFDYRHLHLRSRKVQALLKIRRTFIRSLLDWYDDHGFTRVEAPTFVQAAVEGGATLFKLDYFGRDAYLTQSSQFYLEALIFAFDNVYTIQPSFRAEKSRTRRHLTEFWHFEAEMAWATLEDMMDVVEDSLKYACERTYEECEGELNLLGRKFEPPSGEFPRISYDEAIEIARRKGVSINWGEDLSTEAERAISLEFSEPVFVTRYPKATRAFYHKVDPEDDRKVLCADLLAPEGIGEIVGGGQRIDDLDELVKRIREENLNPEDYYWYLDLRRYGSVPHSGFGLGVDRTVWWISGAETVRDVIPFPRTPTRLKP